MDFVEVPSHLMEYFAWDEAVLGTFAKHHRTDEPVPPQLLHDMRRNKSRFAAMDMQTQVVIGIYDQVSTTTHPGKAHVCGVCTTMANLGTSWLAGEANSTADHARGALSLAGCGLLARRGCVRGLWGLVRWDTTELNIPKV